jgi:hypothetical protein
VPDDTLKPLLMANLPPAPPVEEEM